MLGQLQFPIKKKLDDTELKNNLASKGIEQYKLPKNNSPLTSTLDQLYGKSSSPTDLQENVLKAMSTTNIQKPSLIEQLGQGVSEYIKNISPEDVMRIGGLFSGTQVGAQAFEDAAIREANKQKQQALLEEQQLAKEQLESQKTKAQEAQAWQKEEFGKTQDWAKEKFGKELEFEREKLKNALAIAKVKETQQKAKTIEGKQLPAALALKLSETINSADMISRLKEQTQGISGLAFGPSDIVKGFWPYSTGAQQFKQLLATTKQIIAKGLEEGVLREHDEKKYAEILPKLGDTKPTLTIKRLQLHKELIKTYNADLDTLQKVGYNIGDLEPLEDTVSDDINAFNEAIKNPQNPNSQKVLKYLGAL